MKLSTIKRKFGRKKFLGEVVDVQFVSGEFDSQGQWLNFHKQPTTLHKGYERDGTPILENYLDAVYDVSLKSNDDIRRFRILGKPPEMGSIQSYSHRYLLS